MIRVLNLILLPLLVVSFSWAAESSKPQKVKAVTAKDKRILKRLDKSYSLDSNVLMEVKKTLRQNLLGRETQSSGDVILSKGRLRLNFTKPDKTLVIVDKKTMWIVNYPPAEFEGAPLQVIQAKLNSKKSRSQGLIQMLTKGGIFKHFNPVGAIREADRMVFFMQPKKTTNDFKRAQISVDLAGKKILRLSYWDDLDNETIYDFSNIRFVGSVKPSQFEFTPPADADITVY